LEYRYIDPRIHNFALGGKRAVFGSLYLPPFALLCHAFDRKMIWPQSRFERVKTHTHIYIHTYIDTHVRSMNPKL